MTKSQLIELLSARHSQLAPKDAELAVKTMLDAMSQTLASGNRIEIRGFGSFGLNYRPPRTGATQDRREGAGPAQVRAALQGRQGVAREVDYHEG
jgi:integration host factor subunit beta